MGAPGALVAGVLAAALVAGCGGSGHKATNTHRTPPASTAGAGSSGIASHLLVSNELAGFTAAAPATATTASTWARVDEAPPTGEVSRLEKLGFVRGAKENLTGPPSDPNAGLSLVEQFGTPAEAQSEVAYNVGSFKSENGAQFKAFAVPGIPGARGFAVLASGGGGINLSFAKGRYAYIVGQELGPDPYNERVARLIAAARHLYGRVSS